MRSFFTSLLLVAITFACNNVPTDSSASTTTPSESSAQQNAANIPSGSNFMITVVNDSIKSPRKELKGTIDGVEITINYGSPAVNGRTVFGDLVPFTEVWRTGANEATQLTFSQPLLFGDQTQPVAPGTYALLTRPTDKNNWTVMLNQEAFMWGAYDYDASKDVAQFAATASSSETAAERLDFSLSASAIQIHWADLVIHLPVKAAQ